MEELKASGNAAFKKGDFASAVDFFTRAIDAATLENHHVLYSNRSAARVRCCCRQKSSFCVVLSFRFWRAFFFWSSSSSSKSLVVLCVEERVDRNVCRGSVVSVGLDAFRGDTNLLSVRGGGGGAREEEEEEEEEENYFSKG